MAWVIQVIFLCCCCVRTTSTYWWSLGQADVNDIPQHILINLHRFNRQQKLQIETTPKLLETIGKGASLALQECKRQFQHEKWNCSTHNTESVFGKILNKACRETSFIYSITSAGATYALTESCARGQIKDCFCHRRRISGPNKQIMSNNLIYEGCHDNVQYGYQRAKAFVDATETSRDFHALVNLHNNEAGRQAVVDSMRIVCKCHGVSGNCNVQTCSKSLPTFSEIGNILKKQYDTAAQVKAAQIVGNRRITRAHLRPSNDIYSQAEKDDLIFLEDSPNFCVRNVDNGSLGTEGRYCNSSIRAKGVDGCDILCCGREWETEQWTLLENCDCKFKWCCEVTCKKCPVTRQYSRCK